MKHIGIIGVSAEGAGLCFQTICAEAARVTKSLSHPEISLHEQSSQRYFDTQPQWEKVAELLLVSAKKLALAGADFAIIPSNAMHFALEQLRENSPIPILSIIDVAVQECIAKGYTTVAVLGTTFTVKGGLYTAALEQAGIEIVIPSDTEQERMHRCIFDDIVPGKVTASTTATVIELIDAVQKNGAQAAILGCTELPIVVNDTHSPIPTIDTTRLLAKAALRYAMESEVLCPTRVDTRS